MPSRAHTVWCKRPIHALGRPGHHLPASPHCPLPGAKTPANFASKTRCACVRSVVGDPAGYAGPVDICWAPPDLAPASYHGPRRTCSYAFTVKLSGKICIHLLSLPFSSARRAIFPPPRPAYAHRFHRFPPGPAETGPVFSCCAAKLSSVPARGYGRKEREQPAAGFSQNHPPPGCPSVLSNSTKGQNPRMQKGLVFDMAGYYGRYTAALPSAVC